ncbi:MAG: general secretion pathway protein GspB, partial [Deltaproteobacteria bacterium]|nr:general secretion pathway protein GspB [Deltaproteobacteria bacterium]
REQEPIPTVTEKIEDLPEIAVDSRLKIQAIAWALDPSRRFVVINNSIVRAGGNIDGITVVAIEENIIHFNEDGKEWRQRFFIR